MKQLILAITLIASIAVVHAQPKVGSKAPEIALPNVKGEVIKLSSLNGKVVLIDFWASWCRPCRETNHATLPIYNKFKDKGFEIYGISIDENPNAWKYAIDQDKITWIQVNDKEASHGNELTQTWAIRYIPSTFLIDQNGNVVAVNPSEEKLEKLLKKLLVKS